MFLRVEVLINDLIFFIIDLFVCDNNKLIFVLCDMIFKLIICFGFILVIFLVFLIIKLIFDLIVFDIFNIDVFLRYYNILCNCFIIKNILDI